MIFCSVLIFLQSGLSLSSDGILGPLTPDLPVEGLDLSEVPAAVDDVYVPASSEEEE